MSKTPNFKTNNKVLTIAKSILKLTTQMEEFIDYDDWLKNKLNL